MSFSPIVRVKSADQVLEAIEAQILNGTLEQGAKLPSEEQLAAQLGVGRRAVREALKVLEAKGLIEIQMGVGATVRRNDLDSFLGVLTRNVTSYLSVNKADVKHVVELRQLIEAAGLKRLIEVHDSARLAQLAQLVSKQHEAYECSDFLGYQKWHVDFHVEIVDALENPVISMIYRQVLDLIRGTMEWAGSRPEVSHNAIRMHERILAAAVHGRLDEAEHLLAGHLTHSLSELSRELDA